MPQEYNEDFVLLRAANATEEMRNQWKADAALRNMKFTHYITWKMSQPNVASCEQPVNQSHRHNKPVAEGK